MPFYVCWQTVQCLVLCGLAISALPQTTFAISSTTKTTFYSSSTIETTFDSSSNTETTFHSSSTIETTASTGQPLYCPEPPMLKHGFSLGNKRNQGASIKYYCYNGYELIGTSLFHCKSSVDQDPDGNELPKLAWYPDFSKTSCEIISATTPGKSGCLLPPSPKDNPMHIKVVDQRPFYSEVMYICQEGYTLVGLTTRWCTLSGKWMPEEEPKCVNKGTVTTTAAPEKAESRAWIVMRIVLCVSIPILILMAIATVRTVKKHLCTGTDRRPATTSGPAERPNPRDSPLFPTMTNEDTGHPNQPNMVVTNLLNSDELIYLPFIVTDDEPVPVIQAPPSYDDVTRDSSLPSFEMAQKLYNSCENLQ